VWGWLVAACLVCGCAPGSGYEGFVMDPPVPAPDAILRGADATISFARTGGRVTIATFGYTSCPDVCPATLSDWRRLRRALGADTSRVRFVFVSADWRRDTPATARSFARHFDPSFLGVAPDSTTLFGLMRAFKVAAQYHAHAEGGWDFAHTDYTYVVDAAGRIRLSYEFAADTRKIARDVRRLLAG
jgi:protein SCO1/2